MGMLMFDVWTERVQGWETLELSMAHPGSVWKFESWEDDEEEEGKKIEQIFRQAWISKNRL